MKKIKTRIFAILMVVTVATFTVCKATGANSVSDISGGGKVPGEGAEITFDGNGGTLSGGEASITVTAAGNEVVYPAQQFSRDGYGLLGWYETATEALTRLNTRPSAVRVAEGESVTEDKTLYAAWGAVPQVEFRDGGINDSASPSFSYGKLYAAFNDDGTTISYAIPAFGTGSAVTPATPLYGPNPSTFEGWYDAWENGTPVHVGSIIENPSLTTPVKLYAYWIDLSDTAAKAALEALVATISNDLSNKDSATNTYDDEFLVGNGLSSDASVSAFLGELNTLLQEASVLLAGTQDSASVTTDQGPETIYWTVYDYPAIAVKYQVINAKKQDPLYALAIQSGDISPAIINIAYTGDVQSVTITTTGNYEIDAYGASGGHVFSKTLLAATGGKGGHVTGTVNLTAGTVLKVRVGGEGAGTALFNQSTATFSKIIAGYASTKLGGYNGGGNGGAAIEINAAGSGGGGATDVRIYDGIYSADANNYQYGVANSVAGGPNENLDRRIIVAAGGGGSSQAPQYIISFAPGFPGGDAEMNGIIFGATSTTTQGSYLYKTDNGIWYGLQEAYGGYIPPRSSNVPLTSAAGTGATTTGNQKGQGADGKAGFGSTGEGMGGGGGGFYGGEAIQHTAHAGMASGAGGSNFADSGTLKTVTLTTPIGLNDVYGNGKVTIRYVSP